ncbi:MAG: hypothetical protein H6R14_2934 [Proteobacteria bacterium]|nr:hypothetical protein [Pseudomonadota bacterium]
MLKPLQRILLVLSLVLALPAMAQNDPPARVGRLAYFENQVDFRVDRNEQPGPATLNWPISSGAVLETGQRGRAEVWIGSTAYRLADDSQVEFPVVDDSRVDVRLTAGTLAISILDRDQADDVIVATPEGNIRFLTPGRYRIDVMGDHSELSVQAGRATFDNGQREIPVAAGQKISRWSDGSDQLEGDRSNDAFDRWVSTRENATLAGPARRHVSPHMTGYQDLDAYGDWQTAPDYGAVWYPRAVADDWAPYRYGRWAWVAPWGWTWIDQAPWGFAPFHYGRWAIIHGRWAWVPGRIVARPVYAPALVAWIGNPGWNVSFGFGAAPAVGWFPLAPREVYVPAHRHSHNYVRQINVAYVRDVNVIDRAVRPGGQANFAHHALPRAVTVVPANLVREGRAITAREIRHHERPDLGRAPQARHAPSADWLAPAQGAVRPHGDDRREPINRQRRDFDAPRPGFQERGAPRPEAMPRNPDRPAIRQSMPEPGNARDGEFRRDGWRGSPDMRPGIDNRVRPADGGPAALPQRREAVPAEVRPAQPQAGQPQALDERRGGFRRPGDGQPAVEGGRMPGQDAPPVRREMPQRMPEAGRISPADPGEMQRRDNFRRPPDARPDGEMRGRQPDAIPPRRDMPAPEMRSEDRQPRPMMSPLEREQRREMREIQRMERPAEAPQIMRQPEMPRPAPEARQPAPPPVREMPQPRAEPPRQMPEFRAPPPAPMPQPRVEQPRPPVQEFRAPPPPAPAPMPQPRMEPPRQPGPQGGGQGDPRRRHGDDDRGGR